MFEKSNGNAGDASGPTRGLTVRAAFGWQGHADERRRLNVRGLGLT